MGQPATWWSDQVVWARRCQAQAAAYARAIGDAIVNPADPYADELRRSRRAAALEEVAAWEQYAKDAEAAFQSAAEAEMLAADSRLVDQQRTFGGRPYDVPRCEHGCCADAVCEFVGDCDSHRAAS